MKTAGLRFAWLAGFALAVYCPGVSGAEIAVKSGEKIAFLDKPAAKDAAALLQERLNSRLELLKQ